MKSFGLSAFDCFQSLTVSVKFMYYINIFFHLQGKTKDYDMLIQKLADPDIKVYFAQCNFDYPNSSWDIGRVGLINNLDS